jgi:putative ABC transport system permease protein
MCRQSTYRSHDSMSQLDGWRHRIRVLLKRERYDRDLDDEIRLHLQLDSEQHRSTPDLPNLIAARRRFGNVAYHKEETRRMARLDVVDHIAQDVRHLFRGLRRSPGFAVVSILTLALGIGVTTAVMSIVDHVLLHSLPFRDADRLVSVFESQDGGAARLPSNPTVQDWQRDASVRSVFEGVTFIRGDGAVLANGDARETIGAAYVTPDFFPLLGARPELGRFLVADDDVAGAPGVAVIAHSLWIEKYGGDPRILGRRISIDSTPTTVVGVMAAGASYPTFATIWAPLSHYKKPDQITKRGLHVDSRTIARLRVGVDSAHAATAMRAIESRLAEEYPADQARWTGVAFVPLRGEIIGNIRPMLLTLAGAVGVVLLLACANVGNLLLARASARSRELAVRSALGASRGRIVRQLFTESLALAFIGGGLGTGLAVLAVSLARKLPSSRLPRVDEVAVDGRVLAIAFSASIVTALLCGIWPAIRATRASSGASLRIGASGSVGTRSESKIRRSLVAVQFALALMLLVGAGLLLESFRRVAAVPLGFDPHDLVTVRVAPPMSRYGKPEQAAALYARLMDALRAVPGVRDVATIQHFPFTGSGIYTPMKVDGLASHDSASGLVFYRTASDTYLKTMKMSMVTGRWFTPEDMRAPGGSFIINETLAKRYWAGQSPVGHRVTIHRSSQARADFGQPLEGTIVGVVADVHQASQDVAPDPEIFVPYTLEPWPWTTLVVRTRDATKAFPSIARAVMDVDPTLWIGNDPTSAGFRVVDETVSQSLEQRRFAMSLIGAFAACALILSAIGMYGVIAYGVEQRRREIGVRKALGATDRNVATLVVGESLRVAAVGVVLGCVGAWAGARLIRGMLYDTGPADPAPYAITIVVLAFMSLVASYVPARRASRLDATIAIRGD